MDVNNWNIRNTQCNLSTLMHILIFFGFDVRYKSSKTHAYNTLLMFEAHEASRNIYIFLNIRFFSVQCAICKWCPTTRRHTWVSSTRTSAGYSSSVPVDRNSALTYVGVILPMVRHMAYIYISS